MDDWGDNSTDNGNDDENSGGGRSFGKGRGFVPHKVEDNYSSGFSSDSGERRGRGGYRGGGRGGRGGGFGGRDGGRSDGDGWSSNRTDDDGGDNRRGGFGGRGRGGGRYDNDRDRDGGGGGGGGGGWGSSRNGGDGDDDRRGGRGGGWGGGGRGGRDDGESGGGGGWNSDRRRDDDGGDGRRGGRGGGRGGGGWNSDRRRDDDDGGDSRGGGGGGWNSARRDDDDGDNRRGGGGFGGGRGRRGSDEGDRGEDGEDGEKKAAPITYVPVDLTEDELFSAKGIERGINFDDYENIEVKISGENPPKPIKSFADAQLRELIMTNLRKIKYDKPTPIQKYAIPAVMDGRDLMATAQTGSGKTAAFLLPIIHSIMAGECEAARGSCCSPQALILSPTRELAIQIKDNAKLYTAQSTVKVEILYGGVATKHQGSRIAMGCNIMIATPGRLVDFVNRGWVKFDAIQFVVLDEADRMLDMGFEGEVNKVMKHETMTSQESRQTLMFSATFSKEIQKMAAKYLRPNYLFVTVGVVGGACKDVSQNFVAVERNDKKKALLQLLEEGNSPAGTLIFVETQKQADFLACFLSEKNIKTTSIHGARLQHQREEALRDFKSGKMHVLVATNVAARGLDIVGVRHVVNFDLPKEIDEYVHRIGRTGRLGNKGRATSLYDSSNNSDLANNLVKVLKGAGQNVPDFIQTDSTGGGDYEEGSFGGTDYRRNETESGGAGADEEW